MSVHNPALQHTDKFDLREGASTLLALIRDEIACFQYHCLTRYCVRGSKKNKSILQASALIKVAALEYHCSTLVESPNGKDPKRLGLVYFCMELTKRRNTLVKEKKKKGFTLTIGCTKYPSKLLGMTIDNDLKWKKCHTYQKCGVLLSSKQRLFTIRRLSNHIQQKN